MNTRTLIFGSRELRLDLTSSAEKQLGRQTNPLDIEMELYFSCLVRKRVYFRDAPHADVAARAALTERVGVSFRPVVGRPGAVCSVAEAPLDAVKLVRPEAFTPRWLRIDYRSGAWCGEFGY
jgi:hypothetical protein